MTDVREMTDVRQCVPLDHGGPVERAFEPFPAAALEASITDRFNQIARRFSARVAVSDSGSELGYAELATLVDRIAAATVAAAADRPGPIAVLLARDVRLPAAMLGVLAAKRGYLPLDPDVPIERNRQIIMHAGAAAVISSGALANNARAAWPETFPVLDIDRIDVAVGAALSPPAADDLACIIYTSGSTGKPKGVFHNHRNLLHDVMQQTNALHVNEEDRVALFFSPTIITAIREMLTALLNGAALHILPPQEFQAVGLVREIRARRITICRMVPVLLRRIVEVLGEDERLDSVRVVGLGGQRVDWSDHDAFVRHFSPQAHLMVGIGSTESGGNFCRWFAAGRRRTADDPHLPVGWILPDVTLSVVAADGGPAAPGEIGELVIASRYIALGYWRDPELTGAVFTIDPAAPDTRIFRTGDLGRMRPDGLLEFIGRNDQQIKLRGYRIELGEIESTLAGCSGVVEAAIVVRKDAAGVPQSLAAYVELSASCNALRPRDLRSTLANSLPHYMIPASINAIERLPRLANLKVDRARLAEMDKAGMARMPVRIDDPLIGEITDIFESVLGAVSATPEDNVWSLGGDSLQAVRLAVELEHRFGVRIPAAVFESTQSIRELAG